MSNLVIEGGKVELHKDNGSFIRKIGDNNVFYADINKDGSKVLITTFKGNVELRSDEGSFIRTIGDGNALLARFTTEGIMVTTCKSKIELRNENGEFLHLV